MDDREPLAAFADDSVEPDFYLGPEQLEALHALTDGFRGDLGVAILRDGYAKLIYYDVDHNVIDVQLLEANYGATVPTGLPTKVAEYEDS